MTKILLLLAVVFGLVSAVAYKLYARPQNDNNFTLSKDSKMLIVYYSYSHNTQKVAEAIQKATGADIFEIKAEGSYPDEYRPMTEQAKQEIQSGFRPKLLSQIDNIEQYDTIFLGSPNWWGTITPQVSSFLSTYNLQGKKIIPFITHGGGGMQNTVRDLTAQCQGCEVSTNPWVGYGSRVFGIEDWIEELKHNK